MSRIETEVRRLRGLVEKRRFSEALAVAAALRLEVPENRDILYLLAVSQRYLGRIADALATSAQFEALHPDYGRLFQERGHCLRTVGEAKAAIAAYEHAVALNQTLAASWNALTDLYGALGDTQQAELAAANARRLVNLPPAVVSATNVLSEGDIYGAEDMVRRHLLTHPDDIEAMRLLARIGVRLEIFDDAEFLLESVLVFQADYHAARFEYAGVLIQRHKFALARVQAERLLALDPDNRDYCIALANAWVGLGRHEEALQIYQKLASKSPLAADLHLSIGHALKTLGRQAAAIEAYRQAAAVHPSFGDAYWSLANLKTYRFTDEEIARMRLHEAGADTAAVDHYHLCFALGKALEDRSEFAESFAYYERGNALKKRDSRHQAATIERNAEQQVAVCTAHFFASRRGVGCRRPDPIFIVGLPRAGSTLIEQILASHSAVEGTMELPDIISLARRLGGKKRSSDESKYPEVLADLSAGQCRALGEEYLQRTRIQRKTGKPFFIDKMPNNFMHLGLIRLALPNAKIIDARRHPMACCFSGFKQHFARGQNFSYSLEDIGRYYRDYVELMAHFDRVLPGTIHRVVYENMIDDAEAQIRRLLDFCGLSFEPECLLFYENDRVVRTASSQQVRQPIFRAGLDQWRHFEPWLDPLKAALGPVLGAWTLRG